MNNKTVGPKNSGRAFERVVRVQRYRRMVRKFIRINVARERVALWKIDFHKTFNCAL